MTTTPIIKAWNGKWHIFETSLGWVPAEPVGNYNRVAKPKRLKVLTRCGLTILAKSELQDVTKREDFVTIGPKYHMERPINACKNCLTVLNRRYPKVETPKNWLDNARIRD